jgi:hypothetical protein
MKLQWPKWGGVLSVKRQQGIMPAGLVAINFTSVLNWSMGKTVSVLLTVSRFLPS